MCIIVITIRGILRLNVFYKDLNYHNLLFIYDLILYILYYIAPVKYIMNAR